VPKRTKYNSGSVVNVHKTYKGIEATAAAYPDATWKAEVTNPQNAYVAVKGRGFTPKSVEAGGTVGKTRLNLTYDEANDTTLKAQRRFGRTNLEGTYNSQEDDTTLKAQRNIRGANVGMTYDSRGNRVGVDVQKNIGRGQGVLSWNSQDKDIRAMYYRNFPLGN